MVQRNLDVIVLVLVPRTWVQRICGVKENFFEGNAQSFRFTSRGTLLRLLFAPVRLRKARGTLLLFSLITIGSWLLATNHCAIARELMASATNESVSLEHCPTHGAKPDGKEHGQGQMACCSTLKVSLNPAQSPVSHDGSFFILKWFLPEFLKLHLESEASAVWHPDHGPPKVLSFAEQVLQRSILSNAPPVLS